MDRKETVKYFYEVVVTNHLLEEVGQYVSEDCVLKNGEELIPIGIEGMRSHLIAVKNTYPDYSMKIIRQYCDGDHVISEFIMEGTHKGEWLGMKPTNKKLAFTGVDIDKVMDLLEARIFENYPKVHIDASFPAESMYLRRGYQIISYEKIQTENGDFLCYHIMEKERGRNLSV